MVIFHTLGDDAHFLAALAPMLRVFVYEFCRHVRRAQELIGIFGVVDQRYSAGSRLGRPLGEGQKLLQNLDDQVRDCMQHAADCAERARAAKNPRERKDWQDLEARYLTLARSVELTRRIDRFSNEARKSEEGHRDPRKDKSVIGAAKA